MINLEDTTGAQVSAAIASERHRMGSPATGMVLTLLVITDEESQLDASSAAAFAAQEHPMRILVLIPRRGRGRARLDAQISVGGDNGPGEFATLRLRGELAHQIGSVVVPLLLPDTPVVAWWPGKAPKVPVEDPIGIHAQRRILDSTHSRRQLAALQDQAAGHSDGDTDLGWTFITGWRTLLATTLDQPHAPIVGAEVSVPKSHSAGHLLAAWLGSRLDVPSTIINARGPGITKVRLITQEGEIVITRPDGTTARLTRPGIPPATIALPRRKRGDLLAEELRRLDPDEILAETLQHLDRVGTGRLRRKGDGYVAVLPKSRSKAAESEKADPA